MMYASPLTIVKKVVTTKSVEFMPLSLSLANFLNGCVWTAYALIRFDIFMLVSNGIGAFFGFLQLVLYAFYYKSTPKRGSQDVKPSEIQLSASDAASRA
ncbi:bidirectional sugar transporter SWEET4-like [Populus alba x Populus x berolinensis]|nr:bidirectional sugar transporter SWEET4-like [Populus alba x Populus x berolinensis]